METPQTCSACVGVCLAVRSSLLIFVSTERVGVREQEFKHGTLLMFPLFTGSAVDMVGYVVSTGRYHIVLRGLDPVSKLFWTHLAQPYPAKFSFAAGSAMLHAADNMHSLTLRQRFGN